MTRKRRAIAVVVVIAVATIAACLGPSLSSTEQPAVVIQQGSNLNLGDIMVGATGSGSVTISPAAGSQSSTDTITSITKGSCPGFALQLPPLPATVARTCAGSGSQTPMEPTAVPDQSDVDMTMCTDTVYTFGVTYTPSAPGPASCTITISGSTFGPLSLLVTANGLGQALAMEVTPSAINFGDVRVGNTGSQTVNIRNAGTSSLPISSITITPTTSYSATALGSNPILPGKTEPITVSCTPLTAAAFNSTLTVSGSAGSQSVSLSCRGIMSNLNLTPSPLDLTTRVGEPIQKDVTIQNMGTAPAVLSSIAIVSTVQNAPVTIVNAPPATTSLGAGSSTTVRVQYAPTMPQASTELAKLRVMHDGNQTRDVVINGGALETTMAVFPDTVDFGPVCAGTTEMRDVDVKAGTAGSFRVASFTPPAGPFTFAAKAGTVLPGQALGNQGNKLEFLASVTPEAGPPVEGEVILVTDIPDDKMHRIALRADVLPGGVGASPQSMDFGGVMKNTVSQAMRSEVRNCSDVPLVIDDVHIEGPNAQDFSIVIPGPGELLKTLPPRERIEYHVVVRADTPGAKVATLVVSGGGKSVAIGLVATALGGGDGGLVGERSYYTCDAGGAGGLPLAFALALLGLRRRRRR